MLSILTSTKKHKRWNLDSIGVRRAYFHAPARRAIYVTLPEEDKEEGMCGKLIKAMYGTRDAANTWEYAYTEFMNKEGFSVGKITPCLFWHKEKQLVVEEHGDVFTNIGSEDKLQWFLDIINTIFEVKHKARLGPDTNDDKHVRILNRIITWCDKEGVHYEADQRHAEILT